MGVSKIILGLFLLVFSAIVSAQSVTMVNHVAFDPESKIRNNIKAECTDLGTKLASFTQSFAKKQKIEVSLDESIDTGASGKVLEVYITDAISGGNGWIGHQKYVAVAGTLYENGKEVASFTGGRYSGGGAFGGYKGSCSVLGRCTKALGKDIANWLASPEDGASLGDG
jgi:hypothetical protein